MASEWIGLIGVVVGVLLTAGVAELRDFRQQRRERNDWWRDHQVFVIEEIQRLMLKGERQIFAIHGEIARDYQNDLLSSDGSRYDFENAQSTIDEIVVLAERCQDAQLREHCDAFCYQVSELSRVGKKDLESYVIYRPPPARSHFNERAREVISHLAG